METKKVWTGSERVMGYITAFALFCGLGYGIYFLLPFLIAFVTNLVTFLAVTGGTVLVCGIIIKNRKMISTAYQIVIKKIWSAMINSNPIAIMEIQYDSWLKDHKELNNNMKLLGQSEQELLADIKENGDFAKQKTLEAIQAKKLSETKPENKNIYESKSNKNAIMAQRRVKLTNEELLPRLQFIQTAYKYCDRIYNAWSDDLELLKDDIEFKKKTLKTLSRTNGVFKMAESYLNGDSNKRIMFEEAERAYADQITQHVAEIKRFTETTKNWVLNKDIQDAMDSEQGKNFLSMYSEENIGELETGFKKLMEKNSEDLTFLETSNNMEKVEASTFTKSSTNFDSLK